MKSCFAIRSPFIHFGWNCRGLVCAGLSVLLPLAGIATDEKQVLALQSFLAPDHERAIVEIWSAALEIEGVECAYSNGAIPHMTTGSWRLTAGEMKEAEEMFEDRIRDLVGVSFPVELSVVPRRDSGWFVSFLPKDPDSIAPFHRRAHGRLDFPYETFREQDVPGQWRPHITLFSFPEEVVDAMKPLLERLRQIESVTVTRIGLVGFHPVRILVETELLP